MKVSGLIGTWVLGLGLAVVLLWALGAGAAPAAGAGTIIIVDSTADELNSDNYCSLREAIQAANTDTEVSGCLAGDGADTISLPPDTYLLSIPGDNEDNNLTGDLDVLEALTITGAGPDQTFIDAGGIDRALDVDSDASTVVISGVTILNGDKVFSGGGIETYSADLTLVNVVIRDCAVSHYGGAVRSSYASTVLSETQIVSNTAERGGGVYIYGGDLVVDGGEIVSNTATAYGGGIFLANSAEVTVDGTEIVSNTANYGGGIGVGDGFLTLNDGQVLLNKATHGGGLDVRFGGSATLAGGEIGDNVATGSGGGVHVHTGSATLSAGQITGNEANSGAGVFVSLAGASFTQTAISAITHNTSTLRGGGLGISSGSAWLLGGTIYSNTALGTDDNYGGGGLYSAYGSVELAGGQILENSADRGGGVYLLDPRAVLPTQTGGLIAGNTAMAKGGGVYLRSGVAVLEGGVIFDNSAGSGGGIYSYRGRATLAGGQVLSNSATAEGGGVSVYHTTAFLEMQDGQIVRNTSNGSGGGVHVTYGTAILAGGVISGNSAGTDGGGAFVASGGAVLTQTGGTIDLNNASLGGGGVYIDQGHVTLRGGIVDNDAKDGGGVYISTGSLAMDQAYVLYNESEAGGGIYNAEGTATVVNSNISSNTAVHDGGGIYNEDGPAVITFTTIADNRANSGQGIHYDFDAPVVLNTILANGTPNCNLPLVSNGYNLEDADSCGLDAIGDITGTNPLLGPLAADGDAQVRPLLKESPAIDHGTCIPGITIDQRGMTRPKGDECDIGAYEFNYQSVYLPLIIK